MEQIKVCFIFRKPGLGYSIEILFNNIIRHLPDNIKAEKFFLKRHTGIYGRISNLLDVKKLKYCDVYHITGDVNYVSLSLPKHKTILTIHDIESLFTTHTIKNQLKKLIWLKLPLNHSAKITVISKHTFSQVSSLIKDTSKIVLINNCIEDDWFEKNKQISKKTNNNILIVGTKANKNLDNIAKALTKLDIELTIIGKLTDAQKELFKEYKYTNYGYLTRDQIKTLYQNASLLLFPSLYEGFGIPIIEAQATGTPVITSNLEPMKSVAGKGALLINPHSVNEIRQAVISLLKDNKLRQQLIKQGYANSQNYKCSFIAKHYADLYKQLTQENKKLKNYG